MSETFSKTLRKKFQEHGVFENIEWTYQNYFIDTLIDKVEIFGDFLNDIPLYNRERFIEEEFLNWVWDYYCVNQITNNGYGSYYPKVDASKKIKQIKSTLKDFQSLIEEQFGDFLEELEEYGNDYNIASKEYIDKIQQISEASNTINILYDDLESKKFQWFQKQRFYSNKLAPKKDLTDLLKEARHKYSINATDLDIRDLVKNITTFKKAPLKFSNYP